mgnify:CR=1 FL=1
MNSNDSYWNKDRISRTIDVAYSVSLSIFLVSRPFFKILSLLKSIVQLLYSNEKIKVWTQTIRIQTMNEYLVPNNRRRVLRFSLYLPRLLTVFQNSFSIEKYSSAAVLKWEKLWTQTIRFVLKQWMNISYQTITKTSLFKIRQTILCIGFWKAYTFAS